MVKPSSYHRQFPFFLLFLTFEIKLKCDTQIHRLSSKPIKTMPIIAQFYEQSQYSGQYPEKKL